MNVWILFVSLVQADNSILVDKSALFNKYCRDRDRLITSEEIDEYLLVSAEIDATLVLECNFCNDKEEKQPKIWHYQDRYQTELEREVQLGMDNNMSYNRIYTTPELSLVIKDIVIIDAGIYRCYGEEGQEKDNKFNYRIEPIFKDHNFTFTIEGNITEWEKYREMYLLPVNTRFAISRMSDLAEIRESGVILQVISEWASWSACEHCIHKRGYKTSRGQCRLKREINITFVDQNDSFVINFFRKSPLLPCKSALLQEEFPTISIAIRHLPEFILKETCKNCPATKKMKKGQRFRYSKRYVLAEGAYLTIPCPESTAETEVTWKKDSIRLERGTSHSFGKIDPEAHIMVDTFSTLYLTDVSKHEQGNYTCYVGGINMMQLKVIVVSKTRLLTQAFLRHLGYLGFIFLLTSFCYCAGLILACRQKHRFDVVDGKDMVSKPEEQRPLMQ